MEFVTIDQWLSYARYLERTNILTHGRSKSASTISSEAYNYIHQTQYDRNGLIVLKGWQKAMQQAAAKIPKNGGASPPLQFERFVNKTARRLAVPSPERYIIRYQSGDVRDVYRCSSEPFAKEQLSILLTKAKSAPDSPYRIYFLDRGLHGTGIERLIHEQMGERQIITSSAQRV